jgi:hypothetical protein
MEGWPQARRPVGAAGEGRAAVQGVGTPGVAVMKGGRLVGTERVSDVTEDDILAMMILGKKPARVH